MTTLQNYDWPGNVRELQHVIERAVITSRRDRFQINLPDIGIAEEPPPRSAPAAETVGEWNVIPEEEMQRRERENCLAALGRCNWRVGGPGGAAELLGVSRPP